MTQRGVLFSEKNKEEIKMETGAFVLQFAGALLEFLRFIKLDKIADAISANLLNRFSMLFCTFFQYLVCIFFYGIYFKNRQIFRVVFLTWDRPFFCFGKSRNI